MNRLFSIIQELRSARGPIKAQDLSEKLEVSIRTVYRDIAELQMQGVPILGEAGIGYVLKTGFEMPPLMLTPEELEAAVLGTQWVARCGDKALMKSAASLMDKINNVVPEHLRYVMLSSSVVVPNIEEAVADLIDMEEFRSVMRHRKKVSITYMSNEKRTERVIWPIFIAYFESVRVVAAWCELRQAFRNFRTDRIESFVTLEARYPEKRENLKTAWFKNEKSRNVQIV